MPKLALWGIDNDKPTRLPDQGFLEKHLETWIENDGSLVLEGIRWVGRQRKLPGGGILDLLGLTPEGEWVVAELKAGPVNIAALNQAFGYAIEVGSMDGDELLARLDTKKHTDLGQYLTPRNVSLLLVGTSESPDLERGIRFLEEHGLDLTIRIATFGLFQHKDGSIVLARQIDEREATSEPKVSPGPQRVLDLAKSYGVADELNESRAMADRLGLPLKVWPACFTINSPTNKRKTLIYVGPREGGCMLGYAAETYAETFGVTAAEVTTGLGKNWKVLSKADVLPWLRNAEDFTAGIAAKTEPQV